MVLGRRGPARVTPPAVTPPVGGVPAAVGRAVAPRVEAHDETASLASALVDRCARLAEATLVAEGVEGPAELALNFVGEAEMAALNLEWMAEDGPTDVLSFPLDPFTDDSSASSEWPDSAAAPRLIGDLVICPAYAQRQADARGVALVDELALLVVHGVLHLVGMDHATVAEEAVMWAREDIHLSSLHDPAWTRTAAGR